MKDYVIDYLNEDEFKKLERALKKYNILAFKKLNFDYYPALRNGEFVGKCINKQEDTLKYELKLPSDKMFAQIHGEVKLLYTVYKKDHTIILDTITPTEILLEGHNSDLMSYKGVMISKANASKDKFKVDLLNMLIDSNYYNRSASYKKTNTSKKTNSSKSLQTKKQKLSNDIEDLEKERNNLIDNIIELKAKKEKLEKKLNSDSLDEKNLNTNNISDNNFKETNEYNITFGTLLFFIILSIIIMFILTNL